MSKNTKDWHSYNQELINRGSLTIWIPSHITEIWYATNKTNSIKHFTYSHESILFCLTVRYLYGLALRQTIGLLGDIFDLSELDLMIPDYSTGRHSELSRRIKYLIVYLPKKQVNTDESIHISIDSTVLKVFGEGDGSPMRWKVKQHGVGKRRTWRKLPIVINTERFEILSVRLTKNDKGDAETGCEMMKDLEGYIIDNQINKFMGDGAYDAKELREILAQNGIKQVIPPRKKSVIHQGDPALKERNQGILKIEEIGRSEWKQQVGYHLRSLSETMFFCFKQLYANELKSINLANQNTEVQIKCASMNTFYIKPENNLLLELKYTI